MVAPFVWPLVGPEDERQGLHQERIGHVRVTERAQAPFLQVAGFKCFENFFLGLPAQLVFVKHVHLQIETETGRRVLAGAVALALLKLTTR